MFDPYKIPGSRSLHERKLASRMLLVGETHSTVSHAEMRGRPHRGMLPDVDFSRAVPDYGQPSLLRRIIRMARPRLVRDRTMGPVKTSVPAYIVLGGRIGRMDRSECAAASALPEQIAVTGGC